MSNDNPKNPSWKHNAGASKPAANTSRKPWQPTQSTGPSKPIDPKARFRKRAALAGIFGSLLVALMAVVFNFVHCHKPPAMLVVAPESNASLSTPANVYGARSAQALVDWAKGKNRPRVATDAATSQTRDGWKAALDKTNEKSILLYFAAHGAADRNGPFLWMPPGDAVTIDPAHKLPVKDILQRLAEPALREKHKLVIFDATQVSASWAHGYLHNDFARALKDLEAQIADIPNLVVICSTDEDQRSWISEELRRTIFGHFLETGLRNSVGGKSPRVNAWVLHEYLLQEVSNWASANRDAKQTPILLPRKNAESLAKAIEIVSNPDKPSEDGKSPDSTFTVPENLKAAWEQRTELEKQQPPPETIAPDLWRAYLDALLRWEYLVRADADTTAIEGLVTALASQLRGNPLFESEPASIANSLAVGRAIGFPGSASGAVSFLDVWNPPLGKKREEIWREMRDRPGVRATALRLAAATWVLNHIQEPNVLPTRDNLRKAAEFLAVVEESKARPTETHFLLMLKFLPATQPVDLTMRALKLHREAERVALLGGAEGDNYPYADQVNRWLLPSLRIADEQRRHAEDLLFVADESSQSLCKQRMNDAEVRYRACVDDARAIAGSLRLRDRVFSRLPYYARWLASYRGGMAADKIDDLIAAVETTASGAHELTEMLESVPDSPVARIVELTAKAEKLRKAFDGLQSAFVAEVESLSGTVLPANWHAIDGALTVPFLLAEQRTKLLYSLRTISRSLLTGAQTQAGGARAPVADAQTQARRQGRMALALLGERWIDEARIQAPPGTLPYSYTELKTRINQPKLGAWWESLGEAGEQIGALWRMIPSSIHADLDEAWRGEIREAPRYLARASRLSRLLDSATPLSVGRRPVEDERRYWMHELLLWQARRTAQDGWAAYLPEDKDDWPRPDPTATVKPYCEEAGERYAQAAQDLILGRNPSLEAREKARRLASVTATRLQLKAPEFNLDWRKAEYQHDRDKPWPIIYSVSPTPGLNVGFPALRHFPPKGPIQLKDVVPETRIAITDLAQGKSTSFERKVVYSFSPNATENASGQVQVDLFYRGRVFDMTTKVELAGLANIEWTYRPLTGPGRFAIVGKPGLRQGAVALLVDRTKSMHNQIESKDANGKTVMGRPKIEEAVAALVDVLGRLSEGTNLSIGVFHGDNAGKVHLDWIEQPTLFSGQENQRKRLIAKVKLIEPSKEGDSTPLARAVIDKVLDKDEIDKAFPEKFAGFRSVVVLTDGMDNVSFSKWDKPNTATKSEIEEPGRLVQRALLDCKHDVAMHLILFGLTKTKDGLDEDKLARDQFQLITDPEPFIKWFRTPGAIWSGVRNRQELVDKLEESMLPKIRYVRVTEDGARPKTLPVSLLFGNRAPTPALDPGSYEVRAALMRRLLRLERGDRLLLQMGVGKEGLEVSIPPFASLLTDKNGLESAPSTDERTRLTLAYNSLTPNASGFDLEQYVAMEKLIQGREGELRLARPRFAWFEVKARDAREKIPTFLKIENLDNRVAPAWKVQSGPWPPIANKTKVLDDPASPTLLAWWVDELPNEDRRISIKDLGRIHQDPAAKPQTISIQGRDITVKNIALENEYLKVDLSHDDGIRVIVRLEWLDGNPNRKAPDEFHQFYDGKTRQYRARFGPLEKADLNHSVNLLFFSLDNLKGKGFARTQEMVLDASQPVPSANAKDRLPRMALKE